MIWATVISRSWVLFFKVLFLLIVSCLSIFNCKEHNLSDFIIDHLVMSMFSIISCIVGIGCLLFSVCFLVKTLQAFDVFHFVLQGQICLLLLVSLDFLLLHFIITLVHISNHFTIAHIHSKILLFYSIFTGLVVISFFHCQF